MKITKVETLFHRSGSADEGLVGYGEANDAARIAASAVEELGSRLIGEDPSRIEQHWQSLYRTYHNVRGGPIFTAAAIQVDVCTPSFLVQEMILRHLPTYREILTEPRDGYLDVPTRPGIGFELNEDFFARRRD